MFFRLPLWFLFWTFCEYWMHRLMHVNSRYNPFRTVHQLHHQISMEVVTDPKFAWPKLSYFFFFFDNFHETFEILLGETLPAVLIYLCDPECGLPILVFHYVYEILATDSLLEHNASIVNPAITTYFAVGQFHLEHHRKMNYNFGFTITLWDHAFGTFKAPDFAEDIRAVS